MTTEPCDVSIVIPAYNAAATLRAQLEAIESATRSAVRFEVIVSDNGSRDGTHDIASSFKSRLPISAVDASGRRGANAARNAGVLASSGEFVLFCDADDEVDENWFANLVAALEAGAQLAAGPIDYVRLNPPDVRSWRGSERASVTTVLSFLPIAHTANLGVRRELFDRLGGFDERFPHGGDDIEFVWRAQLAGAQLVEAEDAVVHYRLRPTLGEQFRQARNYGSCEPLLYRTFAKHGLRRRPLSAVASEVWWLMTRLPFARSNARRGAWLRRFGTQYGRFAGSFQHRTIWW